MGNISHFGHSPWNPYGPARLFVETTQNGTGWIELGRISSPSYDPQIDRIQKSEIVGGKKKDVAERITGEMGTFNFTAMEFLDPDVLKILFNDLGGNFTVTTSADVDAETQLMRFHYNSGDSDTNEQFQMRTEGLARVTTSSWAGNLGAPATFTAAVTADATGSGWSTAGSPDYYCWAVPIHARSSSTTTITVTNVCDADLLDVEWCFGDVWDEAGAGNYTGEPIDFANATDKLTFSGTHPAVGPTPDYYAIFLNTTDTITGSTCLAILTPAQFLAGADVLSDVSDDTYAASSRVKVSRNTGTATSPTWSHLTISTNFTHDPVRGAIDYTGIAATTSGERLRVITWFVNDPKIVTDVGGVNQPHDYRKFKVVSLDSEEQGADPLDSEGWELTLYRVNTAGLTPQITAPDDGWYPGTSVSMRCLTDPSNGNKIGSLTTYSKSYAGVSDDLE